MGWLEADGRVRAETEANRGFATSEGVPYLGAAQTTGFVWLGWARPSFSASVEAPMDPTHHHVDTGVGEFERDASGLPMAQHAQDEALSDGDELYLRIAPVAKRLGDAVVRMLSYNGTIPGPTLRVKQGSEIVVHVTNEGDVVTTVHWHGLRLENRYDGVPHDTQKPIEVGETFTYRVRFPDEGVYWYHPHIREDYTQDMGLYGNIIVEPSDSDYWPSVDRDVVVTIDDVLLEDGRIASYERSGPDHVAMGRFGNVFLISGEVNWSLDVGRGQIVRFFLTNTANTRVFDVRIPGMMKLVGGDSGRYERDELVDDTILAPSERAVVDVLFEGGTGGALEHVTPDRVYRLGEIRVVDTAGPSSAAPTFRDLRGNPALQVERARIAEELQRDPDKVLSLVAEMDVGEPQDPESTIYACPMHPDVTANEPGRCPNCGMKLMPRTSPPAEETDEPRFACPMDPEVMSDEPGRCPTCGMKLLPIEMVPAALEHLRGVGTSGESQLPGHHEGGHAVGSIEWEDTMEEINRQTNRSNMRWMLVDRETGARNAGIEWSFTVGDRVKIRIVNEMDSDHPMHHPIHFHGAGRFLVLSRDGVEEPNLVWKDTVLVRTGEVVDILLDVTNPGLWMAHCHIAEHTESGMMFSFNVARKEN
jgi:FtsP/CotA-like multicopper oxidase with cupredoxin domain